MGTFQGHVLSGSIFIILGLWWTVQMFRRYYASLRKNGVPFQSSVTFPSSCLCGRLKNYEIEGCIKILFTLLGVTLELYFGFKDGHFAHFGNAQHATMFFMFTLSGLVDLLVHHKVPLPKGSNYVVTAVGFTIEGIVFSMHLYGRSPMDKQIHWLLVYTVFANLAAVLGEMKYSRNVLMALSRAYFAMCQGTWLWQIGWILYPPIGAKWKEDDMGQMMITVMLYAWHLGANFILMGTIGGVIGCIYRCRGEFEYEGYKPLNEQLLNKNSNGHIVLNVEDSDSDLEVHKPLRKDTA